ncbi:MAG: tetratricopeptide repeat protein [Armatimonadota bacterium]
MKKLLCFFAIILFMFGSCFAQDEKLLAQAQELALQLKFDQAETLCKRIIKDEPENLDAFSCLCGIYTKTGRFNLALFTIEEMKDLKADPGLISLLNGKIYMTAGNNTSALKEFEALLNKESPYYYEALLNSGIIYTRIKDYDKAYTLLNETLNIKNIPQSSTALSSLLIQEKKYPEASNVLSEAIKENYSPALVNLAVIDMKNNNSDTAKEKLNKALEYQPYNLDAYYNLAVIDYDKGSYEDSIGNIYKITDFNIFYPQAGYLMGKNLIAMGQLDEAYMYLNKAVTQYPDFFDAYMELGNLYIKEGNYEKAHIYLKKCMELNPADPNLQILLGTLYFKENNLDKAIECFKSALDKGSAKPDIYYNIAICYQIKKDKENAVKYYKEYLKIKPDSQDKDKIENFIKKT